MAPAALFVRPGLSSSPPSQGGDEERPFFSFTLPSDAILPNPQLCRWASPFPLCGCWREALFLFFFFSTSHLMRFCQIHNFLFCQIYNFGAEENTPTKFTLCYWSPSVCPPFSVLNSCLCFRKLAGDHATCHHRFSLHPTPHHFYRL